MGKKTYEELLKIAGPAWKNWMRPCKCWSRAFSDTAQRVASHTTQSSPHTSDSRIRAICATLSRFRTACAGLSDTASENDKKPSPAEPKGTAEEGRSDLSIHSPDVRHTRLRENCEVRTAFCKVVRNAAAVLPAHGAFRRVFTTVSDMNARKLFRGKLGVVAGVTRAGYSEGKSTRRQT